MGRCAGCPTRPGRVVGGRSPAVWGGDGNRGAAAGGRGADGTPGEAYGVAPALGGCGCPDGGVAGVRWTSGGLGITGACPPSGKPPGKGCLGPDKPVACEPGAAAVPAGVLETTWPGAGWPDGAERTCPGLGAIGKGLAGTAGGRTGAGADGVYGVCAATGGRIGADGRAGASTTGGSGGASGLLGSCSTSAATEGSSTTVSGGSSTATAAPWPLPSSWPPECPSPLPMGSRPKRTRSLSATSSSIELECVSFSDTPISGKSSRIRWDFTSSSRASTLIRIFFIYELNVSVEIPNFRVLRRSHPEYAPRN
jgi:hypothetical protein